MKIKALIFDMDGTLANTLADVAICMNKALCEYGLPENEHNMYRFFMGNGVLDMIRDAIPKEHQSENTIKDIRIAYENLYNEHYLDNTKPFEGIDGLLHELKKMDIKCAILSNKPEKFVIKIAEKIFSDFTFDIIHGDREGIPIKPNPASSLMIAEELGVSPQEILFVGDSDVDMQTAKNANMIGVGALWGFRSEEELLANGADFVTEHPREILNIINNRI